MKPKRVGPKMPYNTCDCDLDREGEYVYLGPGEGLEHQTAVFLAQERYVKHINKD